MRALSRIIFEFRLLTIFCKFNILNSPETDKILLNTRFPGKWSRKIQMIKEKVPPKSNILATLNPEDK